MRDHFKKYITGAFLAGAVLVPGTAWAESDAMGDPTETAEESVEEGVEEDLDAAVEEELDSGDASEKPWSVSLTMESRIGQGTFVEPANDSEYSDQLADASNTWERANLIFGLAPSYTLGDFTFSGSVRAVQWLTAAGGQGSAPWSGGANEPQEFSLLDVGVGASWKGYTVEAIDLKIKPSMSVDLPTSKASQLQTMLFAVGGTVGLSRKFLESLNLSLSSSVINYQYQSQQKAASAKAIGVFRANESCAGEVCVPGYLNTEWIWSLSGSASFEIIKDLSASVSYGLTNYYGYETPDDQYTSKFAVAGRGFSQLTSGQVRLNYTVNDHLSVSGGTYSVQPPMTEDGDSFRFPWWNFQGAAANWSAVTMSVTGSY